MSTAVAERHGVSPQQFEAEILPAYAPVVLRGLAADWPAVAAGRAGPRSMADYLKRFDGGRPLQAMVAPPAVKGRFFYSDDLQGFNFDRVEIPLGVLVDELVKMAGHPAAPAVYAGAVEAAEAFPGWTQANPLPLPAPLATPRLWIGNASQVATHFDMSTNIAVVAAGRRRFSLFPPEAAADLYVGPLDVTIAGQPTSMVDLEAPDLGRYPQFAQALAVMQTADLEPGDAIFIPPMWWHNVKAMGPLNLLVNYWFGEATALSPFTALIHALAAVRDLPPGQRAAVKAWFEHYVFSDAAPQIADHLPAARRGVLGPPGEARNTRTRDYLLKALGGRPKA